MKDLEVSQPEVDDEQLYEGGFKQKKYRGYCPGPRKNCEHCDRSFVKWETLRNHMFKVHNIKVVPKPKSETKHEKIHVCDVCGIAYVTGEALWAHRWRVHKLKKPPRQTIEPEKFACTLCRCKYTRKSLLQRHQLHKHDIPIPKFVPKFPRSFVCDICYLGLTNQIGLDRHKLMRHGINKLSTRVTTFQCGYCEKVFTKEKWYKKHVSVCENQAPVKPESADE